MKKYFFILALLIICGNANAQCESKNLGVEIDEVLGSVKVTSQYTINGQAVDVDGTPCDNCTATSGRYDESQGTLEEILALNASDREKHCENLILRRLTEEKKKQISDAMLAEKKKKNEALKNEMLKTVETSVSKAEVVQTYKDLEIKIDANKDITITDKSIALEPIAK